MPLSNSILAYEDCTELYDRALEKPKGIRVLMASTREAYLLRIRLHKARALHREVHREVYSVGDPLYGRSEYDKFRITVKELKNGTYVYIEPYVVDVKRVEEISDDTKSNETPAEPEGPEGIEIAGVQIRRI